MMVFKKDYIIRISKQKKENKSKLMELTAFNNVKRLVFIREVQGIKVMGTNKVNIASYKVFLRYQVTQLK